jgi:hypothetical protein
VTSLQDREEGREEEREGGREVVIEEGRQGLGLKV